MINIDAMFNTHIKNTEYFVVCPVVIASVARDNGQARDLWNIDQRRRRYAANGMLDLFVDALTLIEEELFLNLGIHLS